MASPNAQLAPSPSSSGSWTIVTYRSNSTVDQPPPSPPDDDEEDVEAFLPLLIVGPPGSGKTTELAAHVAVQMHHNIARRRRHRLRDEAAIADSRPRTALCLGPINTSVMELKVRVEGALYLEADAADRRALEEDVVATCDTIHHTCRRWLAQHGRLIGRPNFAEVCTEQRATDMTQLLGRGPDPVMLDNHDIAAGIVRDVQTTLHNELTIGVPGVDFLQNAIAHVHRCLRANLSVNRLLRFIRQYKLANLEVTVEMRDDYRDERAVELALEMCEIYDTLLQYNGLLDFDDLILYGIRLVEGHAADILRAENIDLIVVDDLHNTSAIERRIIRALCQPGGTDGRLIVASECRSLDAFGGRHEADRSVYGFAGASPTAEAAELVADCIGGGQDFQYIVLRNNERNSVTVQALAYAILGWHLPPPQEAPVEQQFRPRLLQFGTIEEECRFMANEIQRIQLEHIDQGILVPIAILVRCKVHIRFLADELISKDVSLRIMGHDDFSLCSEEAIDLLSFLCAAQDPAMHHNLVRSYEVYQTCRPQRARVDVEQMPDSVILIDFITMTDEELEFWQDDLMIAPEFMEYAHRLRTIKMAEANPNFSIRATLDALLNDYDYKSHCLRTQLYRDMPAVEAHEALERRRDFAGAQWENVQTLLRRARDFDERSLMEDRPVTLDAFLRLCNAYAGERLGYVDGQRADDKVALTTMHYSLGAEYDTVFLSGMERASMPMGDPPNEAYVVERKLLHLAVLRARRRVYFTYCLAGNRGQHAGASVLLDRVMNLLEFD